MTFIYFNTPLEGILGGLPTGSAGMTPACSVFVIETIEGCLLIRLSCYDYVRLLTSMSFSPYAYEESVTILWTNCGPQRDDKSEDPIAVTNFLSVVFGSFGEGWHNDM